MENQHRLITGYRELNQKEIDLMNKVKSLGAQIEAVLLEVDQHISAQRLDLQVGNVAACQSEAKRLVDATPERFAALSKIEFQTGLMYLTRAVAQPTFF